MTWPTGAVSTVDLDASSDSPANARDDILSAIQKLNEITENGEPVALAGNQSVAGTKTFASSPIVPTPSAANHVARKDTVDAAAAAAAAYADSLSAEVAVGGFRGLMLSSTGANAMVSVSAEALMLLNGAGKAELVAPSLSINSGASGAGGLDTGALATNTWYSVWVIWNGTTTSGLLSLSATTPTMPSGYTFKARVGWIRTDGTANKWPKGFTQYGRQVQWRVGAGLNVTSWPLMATHTSLVYSAVGVSAFAPLTAYSIRVVTGSGGNSQSATVGPNSDISSAMGNLSCGGGANYFIGDFVSDIQLESSNIYFSSNSVGLRSIGWEDNL